MSNDKIEDTKDIVLNDEDEKKEIAEITTEIEK